MVDFTLSFKAAVDLRELLIKMEQAKEELPETMTLEETAGGKEAVRLIKALLEKYEEDCYIKLLNSVLRM